MSQCIAIQLVALLFPMDVTNALFLHCDRYNICDRAKCNQPTNQAAMAILHPEFEPMSLPVEVIVMY